MSEIENLIGKHSVKDWIIYILAMIVTINAFSPIWVTFTSSMSQSFGMLWSLFFLFLASMGAILLGSKILHKDFKLNKEVGLAVVLIAVGILLFKYFPALSFTPTTQSIFSVFPF